MRVKVEEGVFVIEEVRHLTDSTYVLRFSKNGLDFQPGQHLVLGLPGSSELREYSIYSGNREEYLEVLIKEVDGGKVSKQLKSIEEGDRLEVRGPYGFFLENARKDPAGPLLFLSSGTGIAPFHSFIQSFPEADYRIIQGIREMKEAYDLPSYQRDRITLCTSRDKAGDFYGRLTDHLLDADLDLNSQVYLCGNSSMIYDAMDILRARGIPQKQIFTEVYF